MSFDCFKSGLKQLIKVSVKGWLMGGLKLVSVKDIVRVRIFKIYTKTYRKYILEL